VIMVSSYITNQRIMAFFESVPLFILCYPSSLAEEKLVA